jgi:hypothetical protein
VAKDRSLDWHDEDRKDMQHFAKKITGLAKHPNFMHGRLAYH